MADICCPKCGDPVDLSTIASTVQARRNFALRQPCDCRECNLNYKSENRKWKGDPQRKRRFQDMEEEPRKKWYKTRKEVTTKLHLNQDTVKKQRSEAVSKSYHGQGTEMRKRVHWKPYSVFESERLARGMTPDQVKKDFVQECMTPGRLVKMVDGVPCLGEFQGLLEDIVTSSMEQHTFESGSLCSTEADVVKVLQLLDTRVAESRSQLSTSDDAAQRFALSQIGNANACPLDLLNGVVTHDATPPSWKASSTALAQFSIMDAVKAELAALDEEDEIEAAKVVSEESDGGHRPLAYSLEAACGVEDDLGELEA